MSKACNHGRYLIDFSRPYTVVKAKVQEAKLKEKLDSNRARGKILNRLLYPMLPSSKALVGHTGP